MGRPRLPEGAARKHVVKLRLNDAEMATYLRQALEEGLTLGELAYRQATWNVPAWALAHKIADGLAGKKEKRR